MSSTVSYVLYARKSTESEDKQMLSIPAQLTELRRFAARLELRIEAELTESYSAREPGRPVFSKLLKDVAGGRVQGILCWKLDRLARNPIDGGALTHYLGKGLLREIVTPEGSYTGSGDSKFMLSVLFGAATKMTDDLSVAVKRGNQALAERGRIPGIPPLGYIKVRPKGALRGAGHVVPDPERFPLIQRLWRELLAGGVTVAELWRRASQEWKLTTRGTKGRPSGPIRVGHIYHLLENPFYTGRITLHGEVYVGEHQPMITPAEFERAQTIVRRTDAPRPSRNLFAYAGFLRCGHCGGRLLVGETHTNRQGHVYVYYRCGRRRPGYPQCFAPAPREEQVTADVEQAMRSLALPPRILSFGLEAISWWAKEQRLQINSLAKASEAELARAKARLTRLTDLALDGSVDDAEYVAHKAELRARISQLEDGIRHPHESIDTWLSTVSEAFSLGATLRDAFLRADTQARRCLLAQVYVNLLVTNRKTAPILRPPFEELVGICNSVGAEFVDDVNPPDVVEIAQRVRKNTQPENARDRVFFSMVARIVRSSNHLGL